MGHAGYSEGDFAKLNLEKGGGKPKGMVCCPLSNHVDHLERTFEGVQLDLVKMWSNILF